jgi:hypothetical protein
MHEEEQQQEEEEELEEDGGGGKRRRTRKRRIKGCNETHKISCGREGTENLIFPNYATMPARPSVKGKLAVCGGSEEG